MDNELLHRYRLLRHKFGASSATVAILHEIGLKNELIKNGNDVEKMSVSTTSEIDNPKISTCSTDAESEKIDTEPSKIDTEQQANIKEQSAIKTIVAFVSNNADERTKLKKTIMDTNELFSDIEILVINNDTNCTSENMQEELKGCNISSVIDASNLLK